MQGVCFIYSNTEFMILHRDVCSIMSSGQLNRNVWWTPEAFRTDGCVCCSAHHLPKGTTKTAGFLGCCLFCKSCWRESHFLLPFSWQCCSMHLCARVEEKAMHKILNFYIMQLDSNQRVIREFRQLQKLRFCCFNLKQWGTVKRSASIWYTAIGHLG